MKRILVIEDDEAVRNLIVETLRTRRWEVIQARDGKEGCQCATQELPDLIICDIQMPEKDGFEVLRELRGTPATATTPFIFLTGVSDKPRMRLAMELGADDFLSKPFTIQELLAAVEARFQKQDLLLRSSEEKLDELRGSLTSALPHELVTPLNSILGFSSLILDSAAAHEIKEYAGLIRNSAERLKSLIEKFLLFAQLEVAAGDPRQRLAVASRRPGETADTIITTAERAAQEKQRPKDLQVQVAPAAHRISTSDLTRLTQELLENAFKFSEPGTAVQLRSREDDSHFVLEVHDRGRGMSAEQIRRADAHVQFDRRLMEQQGTGLGLAICRRIVDLYGGTLKIRSAPGEGTCVTVLLPA